MDKMHIECKCFQCSPTLIKGGKRGRGAKKRWMKEGGCTKIPKSKSESNPAAWKVSRLEGPTASPGYFMQICLVLPEQSTPARVEIDSTIEYAERTYVPTLSTKPRKCVAQQIH